LNHVTSIYHNNVEDGALYYSFDFIPHRFSDNHEYKENKFFVLHILSFTPCHIDVNTYKKEEIKDKDYPKNEIVDDQENEINPI